MSSANLEATSALTLGARGDHRGARFTLAGRTCLRSRAGALWNEWLVAYDDGRRAFLAEAMGAFTLFVEAPALAADIFGQTPGAPLETGFVVVERGIARAVARWGDAPELPKSYRYVDLSAGDGRSATIDLGDPKRPVVYVGERARLADLALRPREGRVRLLKAPRGRAPRGLELVLAIGDEGQTTRGPLRGASWRVMGAVHRSLRADGERFTWEEYLLHDAAEGLRWLVVSDGHWSFVEPVAVGAVAELPERAATFGGTRHRFFSSGTARLEWAIGELPWQAHVGDTVRVRDYVNAPSTLSREATEDEVAWSRGTYLDPSEVTRAFGERALPHPRGRAPNQPARPKSRTRR